MFKCFKACQDAQSPVHRENAMELPTHSPFNPRNPPNTPFDSDSTESTGLIVNALTTDNSSGTTNSRSTLDTSQHSIPSSRATTPAPRLISKEELRQNLKLRLTEELQKKYYKGPLSSGDEARVLQQELRLLDTVFSSKISNKYIKFLTINKLLRFSNLDPKKQSNLNMHLQRLRAQSISGSDSSFVMPESDLTPSLYVKELGIHLTTKKYFEELKLQTRERPSLSNTGRQVEKGNAEVTPSRVTVEVMRTERGTNLHLVTNAYYKKLKREHDSQPADDVQLNLPSFLYE